MKRTTKYVGLDVHQATTVVSVRERSGRVIDRTVLPTDAHVLTQYVSAMRGSVRIALEEGTQAEWLHGLLSPIAADVVVCNRRGERRQRGNKADAPDADDLSRRLLNGDLRVVYHGSPDRALLREFARAYLNLVDDSTRAMLRLKSLYRARGISARGTAVYSSTQRPQWLQRLPDSGARFRADGLLTQIDLLRELRQRARAALVREARRDPAYRALRSIPFLGPVRIALLLATMKTPWRFRGKRNLWAYAGLAVVTETSAEFDFAAGQPVRRRRKALTRGLNRNGNRVLKNVFKSAAAASLAREGPFRAFYTLRVEHGMRPDMARLTLARKIAAIALRTWKSGEPFNAARVTLET
jgi:transposase